MGEGKSIQQRVAERIIRVLRSKSFGAAPVNMSENENNWNIKKICITKQGRDICDINCRTVTISYLNSFDRNTINDIMEIIKSVKWENEVYRNAPNMEIEGLKKYKLLSQYNDVVLAACEPQLLTVIIKRYISLTMLRGKGTKQLKVSTPVIASEKIMQRPKRILQNAPGLLIRISYLVRQRC